jgi:hypothetical protein
VRNAARSKYGQIPQYRKNADDDDDNPHDLFHAAVEREPVDEIEQQNNDQKDDQDADQKIHGSLPPLLIDPARALRDWRPCLDDEARKRRPEI